MIFVSHKICSGCNLVFHKRDMVEDVIFGERRGMTDQMVSVQIKNYFCKSCHREYKNRLGYHQCECGKWIRGPSQQI